MVPNVFDYVVLWGERRGFLYELRVLNRGHLIASEDQHISRAPGASTQNLIQRDSVKQSGLTGTSDKGTTTGT